MRMHKRRPYDPIGKLIHWSDETASALQTNLNVICDNVNSHFIGIDDLEMQKYLELFAKTSVITKELCDKIGEISELCKNVQKWIDNYSVF